jgi:hypothetical protein
VSALPKDYLEKYGPMLHLLEDFQEDLEYLASETGYRRDIGRDYRNRTQVVLKDYLAELIKDFEDLSQEAASAALRSEELARQLVKTRKAFDRCVRYIKLRVLLDKVFPVPRPASRFGPVRRTLINLLPQRATPYELLAKMNNLRTIINIK